MMWVYLVLLWFLRRIGATWSEKLKSIWGSSRAPRASRRKRELRLTLPGSSTVALMVESFSPNSLAIDLTEKVSGVIVSQMMEPPTEREKRAANLVTRTSSSRSRVVWILDSLGISLR